MKGSFLILLTILSCLSSGVIQSSDDSGDSIALENSKFSTTLRGTIFLAELGHAESQFRLGEMYENGHGTQQDIEIALRWYTLAAQQGYTEAQIRLGHIYFEYQRLEAADRWFTKAIEQGDADLIFEIGELFQWGVARGNDIAAAYYEMVIEKFTTAAEKGNANAQFKLGYLFDNGFGESRVADVALKWYSLAAEQDHSDALFNLSQLCQDSKHDLTTECEVPTIELLTRAAEQGSAQAQYKLGSMNMTKPEMMPERFEAGVDWLLLAAEQGVISAQLELGELYEHYVGDPTNAEAAVKWYTLAAEQQNLSAQLKLGELHELGNGVPRNIKEAVKWYTPAAELGEVSAQLKLGELYEHGVGIPKDIEEAVKWYTLAAEQGDDNASKALYTLATETMHANAQYSVGEICNRKFKDIFWNPGSSSSEVDFCVEVPGMNWISLAAEQGHADAQYKLGSDSFLLDKAGFVAGISPNWWGEDEDMRYLIDSFRRVGIEIDFEDEYWDLQEFGIRWLRRAAEQGHTGAQNELGELYESGTFVRKNIEEAFKWYTLAAEQGDLDAQIRLGEYYISKSDTVQNIVTAAKYFASAAA